MKVIVIFTYGISLKHWVDSGIYDREMLLYQSLEEEYNVEFTFITFGDSKDFEYFTDLKNRIFCQYIRKSNTTNLNF